MQLVSTLATGEPQPRRKSPRNQLGGLVQQIRAEHQAVVAAAKSGIEHAMAAGDLLLEAKRHVGRGQWTEWLKRSCEISDRTAQVYMQLAENRAAIESKAQHAADLSVRGALKIIAAPSKAKSQQPVKPVACDFQPKKRATRHDLMAVWLNTPAEDRLHFMADAGLMWRRDAEADEAPAPPPPVTGYAVPDDLSIPECLRRVS